MVTELISGGKRVVHYPVLSLTLSWRSKLCGAAFHVSNSLIYRFLSVAQFMKTVNNEESLPLVSVSKGCHLYFKVWNDVHLHLHLHLGFVHPLQDVDLHQCLPSSSVCCFPNPGGSLLLCYVILPSSAWSSSRPLPSPWLPLCASPCPPIVL